MRGSGGILLTRIAVTLVVVAQVNEIEVAVHGAGGGRHPHSIGRTIAGDDNHFHVFLGRQLFLLEQDIDRVAHALRARRRRRHRGI